MSQSGSEIFKAYSQAELRTMREALARLDRQTNERGILSTQKAS